MLPRTLESVSLLFTLGLVSIAIHSGCSRGETTAPAARSAAGVSAAESPPIEGDGAQRAAAPTKSPLPNAEPSEDAILDLEVPGFEPALVVLPGGTGPHPVLFAAHGAGGRAEYQCAHWLRVLREPYVIVCPRGTPMVKGKKSGGYYYQTHLALEKEVLAIAEALKKLSSPATPPWVYAGYSQGATMGALMLVQHGDLFNRLILLEGGTEGWSRTRSQKYVETGGQRVLFGCGTASCERDAKSAEATMSDARVDVRLRMATGAGHTYGGGVEAVTTPELRWLFGATRR